MEISEYYKESKSAMPKLKQGETYCLTCRKIFKSTNIHRHDNSLKHEKNVHKLINGKTKL